MIKRKFFIIILLFASLIIQAQTKQIDSLKSLLQQTKDFNKKSEIFSDLIQLDTLNSDKYIKQLLAEAPNDSVYFDILINIANYYNETDFEKSKFYVQKCITEAKEKHNLLALTNGYYQAAYGYTKYAKFDIANDYYDSAITYALQLNDSILLAKIYNGAGSVNYRTGNYEKALVNYQKSLEIAENKNLSEGLPTLYANIGLIHEKQQNYTLALQFLRKSYLASKKLGAVNAIIGSTINLADIFLKISKSDSAKKYIKIAIDSSVQINNKYLIMHCRNILGDIYKATDSLQKAIAEYQQVIEMAKMMQIKDVAASAYLDLAEVSLKLYDSLNNFSYNTTALNSALTALDISKQIKALPIENRAYQILYQIYESRNDFKNAFLYAQKFIESNQILFNQEKTKAIEEMQAKYNNEKQKQEILRQQLEIEKKDALVKRQKITQSALIGGSLMLLLFLLMIYSNLRRKKRDNETIQQQNAALQQANEEIIQQRDILQEQKVKIETIHQQLTASINYAERIQLAAMPSKQYLNELFGDKYFLIFKPLNIVSGDFYWAKKVKNTIIFTVADCTGHGVPGAFVSMLGISLLNEIAQYKQVKKPSEVLEIMRTKIKVALKQGENWEDSKDGMDMALCAYYPNESIIEYAGANNPLIHITKDGELSKIKPVRTPVGIYFIEKKFETKTIKVEQGDTIYLFSDGITDQFGGENEEKFMMKRLKDLLLEIHDKTPEQQKSIIDNVISEWKGDAKQTDDITIMGITF